MTLTADIQKFNLGAIVDLYELDLSAISDITEPVRFVPYSIAKSVIPLVTLADESESYLVDDSDTYLVQGTDTSETATPSDPLEDYEGDTLKDYSGDALAGADITPDVFHYNPISWDGNEYIPMDVEMDEIDTSTKGTLPRPKIRIANINNAWSAYIIDYNDLIGAKLTRTRTFAKYLDGMPEADSSMHFPADEYYVQQKTTQNPMFVEFELSSLLDYYGLQLPARLVIREYCTHIYRQWINGAFDYSFATCPYVTESTYYDELNAATTASKDKCSKRRAGCKLRYPTGPIPFRGFLGVERLDV